jgi:hypothetical protein
MSNICEFCKNSIEGKYYTYEDPDLIICDKCFSKAPKCSTCTMPIKNHKIKLYKNYPYCENCFNNLNICNHCHSVIKSTYYEFKDYNLCARCNLLSKCNICKKPCGANTITLDTNHFICETCQPECVLDHESLKNIFKTALIFLNKFFNIKIKKLRKIKLISKAEMIREGRPGAAMYNMTPFNVAGIASQSGDIYVCYGDLKIEVLTTMIHELGHIWQFENWENYSNLKPYQIEGFCNWLEYKVLIHIQKNSQAEKMLEDPDEIYGDGLRYIITLEKTLSKIDIIQGKFTLSS